MGVKNVIGTLAVNGALTVNDSDVITKATIKTDMGSLTYKTTDPPGLIGVESVNIVTGIGTCDDRDLIIPSSHNSLWVREIGTGAFQYQKKLRSVVLPKSISHICKEAFSGCRNLKSIFIPKSVSTIEEKVFLNCPELTIYCEASSQPKGWNAYWNLDNRPVVWGCVMDFEGVNKEVENLHNTTDTIDKYLNLADTKTIAECHGYYYNAVYFDTTNKTVTFCLCNEQVADSTGVEVLTSLDNIDGTNRPNCEWTTSIIVDEETGVTAPAYVSYANNDKQYGFEFEIDEQKPYLVTIKSKNDKIPFSSIIEVTADDMTKDDFAIFSAEQPLIGTANLKWASFATGFSVATGTVAFASGTARAYGDMSHAEGQGAIAYHHGAHAEGVLTTAEGYASHAEGQETHAQGQGSHAEGSGTMASGMNSHTEGVNASAEGEGSHAEGRYTTAKGQGAHAQGSNTIAEGKGSHSEGLGTYAGADYDQEGNYTNFSEDDGVTPILGDAAHAEGYQTRATGEYSHAEGKKTYAKGNYSHAGGSGSQALGDTTFATGAGTIARGHNSAAFGSHTIVGKESDVRIPVKNDAGEQIYIGDDGSRYTYNQLREQYAGMMSGVDGDSTIEIYTDGTWEVTLMTYTAMMKDLVYGVNSFVAGDSNEVYGDNSFGIGKTNIIDEKSYDTTVTGYNNKIENSPYILGAGHNNTIKDAPDAFVSGINNKVSGQAAHVEGMDGYARGQASHVEGKDGYAYGIASHSEGSDTSAYGHHSHAEGTNSVSSGNSAHAEGYNTEASGFAAHAEGGGSSSTMNPKLTLASGDYSHAEGQETTASGSASHSEGYNTTASGLQSHAEGLSTTAKGHRSHTEGRNTSASANQSHAEGDGSKADGINSHAEGEATRTVGIASHAEGRKTRASGEVAHSEGDETIANGYASHAEGDAYEHTTYDGDGNPASMYYYTTAEGQASHAEGMGTRASGVSSHAEGIATNNPSYLYGLDGNDTVLLTEALGDGSHAEGVGTSASGKGSHAEGLSIFMEVATGDGDYDGNGIENMVAQFYTVHQVTASGDGAHAEGIGTNARGYGAHVEGVGFTTKAIPGGAENYEDVFEADIYGYADGVGSHAEGVGTRAIGEGAHAEGYGTEARGNYSHAGGVRTVTTTEAQTVIGKYNAEDNSALFIVGNGGSDEQRSNAFAVCNNDGITTLKLDDAEITAGLIKSIGNIEVALDNIIAIQNSLIGGETV